MARSTTRASKRKTTRARPAKKKAAPRRTPIRRATASREAAELRAEIRRLRLEILALQAKLGEVPATAFDASADEPAVV